MIKELETRARTLGHAKLYIGVDLAHDRRVFDLYRRLGYLPTGDQPCEKEMVIHGPPGTPPVKRRCEVVSLVKDLGVH